MLNRCYMQYVVIQFKTLKQYAFACSSILADKAMRFYSLRQIVFSYDDLAIANSLWDSLEKSSSSLDVDFNLKGCSFKS